MDPSPARARKPMMLQLMERATKMLERTAKILKQLRASHPRWFLLADALAVVPLMLAAIPLVFVGFFLLHPAFLKLCRLQDYLSERHRRAECVDNSANKAAQLPEELQLAIFQLLRTRARFGSTVFFASSYRGLGAKAGSEAFRNKAAARLVCRDWHRAATIAFYTDISPRNLARWTAFSDTLVAHPDLARFVRRIKLPPVLARADPEARKCDDRPPIDFDAVATRVLAQCTLATEVAIYSAERNVLFLLVQLRSLPRLTHFLCSMPQGTMISDGPYVPGLGDSDLTKDLDLCLFAASASRLQDLQSLTLTGYDLKMPGQPTVAFHRLHTLRIQNCCVGMYRARFVAFLDNCMPGLRVFDWRANTFLGEPAVRYSAAELLGGRRTTVIETCVLLNRYFSSMSSDGREVITTLGAMDAFISLCSLTIDDIMLFSLTQPPPRLSELIVVFARNFEDVTGRSLSGNRRRALLFTVADYLKRWVPYWVEWFSPSLRSLQLWDTIDSPVLPDWRVVAYLLRDYLLRFGVELAVCLRLCWAAEERFLQCFQLAEVINRVLWLDVL